MTTSEHLKMIREALRLIGAADKAHEKIASSYRRKYHNPCSPVMVEKILLEQRPIRSPKSRKIYELSAQLATKLLKEQLQQLES